MATVCGNHTDASVEQLDGNADTNGNTVNMTGGDVYLKESGASINGTVGYSSRKYILGSHKEAHE